MTCVTVESVASPAIRVRNRTPLVQNVKRVLGETLGINQVNTFKTIFSHSKTSQPYSAISLTTVKAILSSPVTRYLDQ